MEKSTISEDVLSQEELMKKTLDEFLAIARGTHREIAEEANRRFGTQLTKTSVQKRLKRAWKTGRVPSTLKRDRQLDGLKEGMSNLSDRYQEALKLIAKLETEQKRFQVLSNVKPFAIEAKRPSGTSESTVIVLASDWHVEERVLKESTNNLNEFNLDIARQRATEFFRSALRLTQILQKDTAIDTMVLALLGDFISGNIHPDIAENREGGTNSALQFAEKLIISGIEFLLKNSKLSLVIPCHSGNHGRATQEQRIATENENSHEYQLYLTLAMYFRNEKRVKFHVSPAYHSYLTVYDKVLRFHHGHFLRFQGGVGGITIPVNKAIAQWNKARRADIDFFGHWHTRLDGKDFVSNGSLIGYNPYAVSIKADYEKPAQQLVLLEKSRAKTCVWPILFKV